MMFAMGEAIAHLHYLLSQGKVNTADGCEGRAALHRGVGDRDPRERIAYRRGERLYQS